MSSNFIQRQSTPTGLSSDLIREQYRALLKRTLVPGVHVHLPGSPGWARLPEDEKNAAVICAAMWWVDEANARVDATLQMNDFLDQLAEVDAALDRLADKRAAIAVSRAQEWGRNRPTLTQLQAYRATHPEPRPIDPEAVRRWVETGSSTQAAPTAPIEAEGDHAA